MVGMDVGWLDGLVGIDDGWLVGVSSGGNETRTVGVGDGIAVVGCIVGLLVSPNNVGRVVTGAKLGVDVGATT